MQKLIVGLVIVVVVMGAFVVGQKWRTGQSQPRTLKEGESAQITLRGTLVPGPQFDPVGLYLVGPDWQIGVDVSALKAEEANPYINKTVRISGTQRFQQYFPKYQLSLDNPEISSMDVLFATQISPN